MKKPEVLTVALEGHQGLRLDTARGSRVDTSMRLSAGRGGGSLQPCQPPSAPGRAKGQCPSSPR